MEGGVERWEGSVVVVVVFFFFFQAGDGIRDLVRSRGLGDVYKEQAPLHQEMHRRVIEKRLVENQGGGESVTEQGVEDVLEALLVLLPVGQVEGPGGDTSGLKSAEEGARDPAVFRQLQVASAYE